HRAKDGAKLSDELDCHVVNAKAVCHVRLRFCVSAEDLLTQKEGPRSTARNAEAQISDPAMSAVDNVCWMLSLPLPLSPSLSLPLPLSPSLSLSLLLSLDSLAAIGAQVVATDPRSVLDFRGWIEANPAYTA